ncbi:MULTISPECIES: ABC transporter ATP-binding protein [Mammaliicoccus]|uniref:ABC transporter ATP-binding protein n=1 Tax=Mammaliicoccus lentus TaxID=42858 RepID=A0ABS6GU40_MAMLE|nr:ABC transporter ATP-binding protein [Mammaliicoccus lentus]MBU6112939.1 ABC transporter ATP-binding protein [Mammaliicoccus lentus]
MRGEPILEVKNLCTGFYTKGSFYNAIEDVNINVFKGEVLGVVGESGSGKSVLSNSIMNLLPEKTSKISAGEIYFKGNRIDNLSESELNKLRGKEIAMIFQEPMTSLNPVFTIGNQLSEMIKIHLNLKKSDIKNLAIELLKQVGIPRAEQVMNEYPHQLSGGMRQRVMIAMSVSCMPSLLIADEPTTALDVTVQAQILDLLKSIQNKTDMSIIFISHDLGVISEVCDRVAVMYAGKVVEIAEVNELFTNPKHPYTQLLLKSIPRLDKTVERLETIMGIVPGIHELANKGCRFCNRCPVELDICKSINPPLINNGNRHSVFCHLHNELPESLKGSVQNV